MGAADLNYAKWPIQSEQDSSTWEQAIIWNLIAKVSLTIKDFSLGYGNAIEKNHHSTSYGLRGLVPGGAV